MRIATGTYTGNGTVQAPAIMLPFVADKLYIKGSGQYSADWAKRNWVERSNGLDNRSSAALSVSRKGRQINVGTAPEVNSAGVVYHYIALAEDGSQALEHVDIMGNAKPNRLVKQRVKKQAKFIYGKRDNGLEPVAKSSDSVLSASMSGGGTSTSGWFVSLGTGTFTVSESDRLNQFNVSGIGEGVTFTLFFEDDNSKRVTWTGDGTSGRVIPTGLASIKGILAFADATFTVRLKTDTMGTFETAPSGNVAFNQNEISFSGGNLVIGSDTALNGAGVVYHAMVFGADSGISVYEGSLTPTLSNGSGRKIVRLPGRAIASRIELGTSDTLKIDGAISFEWMGSAVAIGSANAIAGPYWPLIMRNGGPIATAGNVSWSHGLQANRSDTLGWSGPQFTSVATNSFDTANNPSMYVVWRTGILPPRGNRFFHSVLTHDGLGLWTLYIDGQMVKQRNINAAAEASLPNIQSGTGHRTTIGATWDGSAYSDPFRLDFALARVYASELTETQVLARYRRAAWGDTSYAEVPGFVEEWDAANASGTSLPATVNAANNGTIVNGAVVTLGAGATLSPTAIPGASAVGGPSISLGAVSVTPTGIASTETFGSVAVASATTAYDTEVQNAFNAMTVQPSTGRKTLYNNLIVGLKVDGDWASLDWFAVLAAETAQAGRVNLKNPSKILAAVNVPTFTADRGYQGDGSSAYLDFGEAFNAAGNSYATDNAHIGAWCNAVDASTGVRPHVGSTQSTRTLLTPSTGTPGHRMNDATAFNPPTEGTRLGHRTLTRTGSNARAYFYAGSLVLSDAAVSVAVATGPAFALRNGTTYAPDRLAAVYSGSGLTTAAVSRIHSRLSTFLSAIGAI